MQAYGVPIGVAHSFSASRCGRDQTGGHQCCQGGEGSELHLECESIGVAGLSECGES